MQSFFGLSNRKEEVLIFRERWGKRAASVVFARRYRFRFHSVLFCFVSVRKVEIVSFYFYASETWWLPPPAAFGVLRETVLVRNPRAGTACWVADGGTPTEAVEVEWSST